MAQMVKHLPSQHKAQSSNPSTIKKKKERKKRKKKRTDKGRKPSSNTVIPLLLVFGLHGRSTCNTTCDR
jgi:hypothetical protein